MGLNGWHVKRALTTFNVVAGAGIAPASRGYGPREILLLHPADFIIIEEK